jgi:dCTP deaminase
MAVIDRERLAELLSSKTPVGERLVVSPILEPDDQVGNGSIDVRLGNYFIVTRTARVGGIQPFEGDTPANIARLQETLYVPFTKALWIHPGTFVLGGTFEYLRLPMNLYATVTARSSWGRLGLNIATAVAIHPGFYGCLTLGLE